MKKGDTRPACTHRHRAGKTMNFKDLSVEDKLENRLGHERSNRKVEDAVANLGKRLTAGGSLQYGDNAHYNGDWLKRAVARRQVYTATTLWEAMYPLTRVDGDGQTLDGSKHITR